MALSPALLRPGAVPPRCSRADSAGTINGANQRGLIKEILIPSASRPAPLSAPGAAQETKGGGGGAGPRFVGAEPGRPRALLCARGEQRRARSGAPGPERSARSPLSAAPPGAARPRSHAGLRCTAPRAPTGSRGWVLPCGAVRVGSPKNGAGVGVRRGGRVGTQLYWHLPPSQSLIPTQHPCCVQLCSSRSQQKEPASGLLPFLPMLWHSPRGLRTGLASLQWDLACA